MRGRKAGRLLVTEAFLGDDTTWLERHRAFRKAHADRQKFVMSNDKYGWEFLSERLKSRKLGAS